MNHFLLDMVQYIFGGYVYIDYMLSLFIYIYMYTHYYPAIH